jgi:membrane-associated HD superfamily phosphohydrolase
MKVRYLKLLSVVRNRIALVFRNRNLKRAFYVSVALTVLSTLLLSLNLVGHVYSYRIGDIASEHIRVPSDIVYEVQYESDLERQRAAESSPLVFDRDSFVLQEKLKLVNAFFFHLANTLRSYPFFDKDDAYFQLKDLHKRLPDYLRYEDGILRAYLSARNAEELRIIIVQILNEIYNAGILDKPYDNPLNVPNNAVVIRTTDENMSLQG